LAQFVTLGSRSQPSCIVKKGLSLQQPRRSFDGDLLMRHGVPPSRPSNRLAITFGPLQPGRHDATHRPSARLANPSFAREPSMIGAADRTTGAPEEHRAALKAFVIGLNARRDRTPGLRAFDHDHPHVILPIWYSCVRLVCRLSQEKPAGWMTPLVGASGDWGACTDPSLRVCGHSGKGVLQPAGFTSLQGPCAPDSRFSWLVAIRW
jgi:hypothetical protein